MVDQWHLARKLYLEDCERQMIVSQVDDRVGRPARGGVRGPPGDRRRACGSRRRAGTGEIAILSVSNTVPYEFVAVGSAPGEPVAVLGEDTDTVSVPVRFEESRCDPHALAEVKQPTKFISQVTSVTGRSGPYIIYPERTTGSRCATAADACVILGEVEFVGDEYRPRTD